jgi:hypothetical protein
MKEELFDNCQQILDFFHLCEKISTFAKEVFSLNEEQYKPWAKSVCNLFKTSKTDEAIATIKALNTKQIKKSTFDLLGYIDNNKDNIDYALYRQKGFFIGSGAIESANKTVLHRRMKLPGMRWNISSGQNIVTLTSKFRSQLWDSEVVKIICQYYGFRLDYHQIKRILCGL